MRTVRNLSFVLFCLVLSITTARAHPEAQCDRVTTEQALFTSWQGAYDSCLDTFGEDPANFCDDACYTGNANSGGECEDYIYSQQESAECHIVEVLQDTFWIYGAHCACAPDEWNLR